ncbi:MAG TPA: GDSL-type esterase/lipase family protein [Xanthobacteraceae bacterium]|nr:GDSL-type esterase/lipase family protein [Xanthobacteraceae bacterium]
MAAAYRRRLIGALAIAAAAAAIAAPAAAQVYYWSDRPSSPRYYQQPPGYYQQPQQRDFFSFPFYGGQRRAPVADYTKAPPPRKLETPPASTIVVVGDSMADWLGYGLDEIYGDQPDTGVVRDIRAASGLIRYDSKNEQLDWSAVIKDQLASEKPKVIIVMLGLNDRISIRDNATAAKNADAPAAAKASQDKAAPDRTAQDKAGQDKAAQDKAAQDKATQDKAAQDKATQDKATQDKAAQDKVAPDKSTAAATSPPAADNTTERPVPGRSYEFHTDLWADLYVKRVDEMIAALKSKGVPVLWIGLPALRGPKSTSEMAYLDELYRERAERAGIVYIDIWDGFVDDQGRYAVDGPDFEGQIRRLRTADGVHFTKAGAVKLASYVDQELRRVLSNHSAPIALPEQTSPANKPGAPRPDVGPVLPLAVSSTEGGGGGLVGGPSRPAPLASDSLAQKVLDRGAPLAAVGGRADDFSWPPRAAPVDAAPQPVSQSPAVPAKKGADAKPPADAKKDTKKKPEKESDARPAHQPRAELDGARRPPKDIGGGF